MSTAEVESFVGIDVAQATLDIAVIPSGEHWQVANEPAALEGLVQRLHALSPTLIVLEATGGLEIPVAGMFGVCRVAGLHCCNPGRVAKRDHSRSAP